MSYGFNPSVTKVEAPPIAEALGWMRPSPRNRPYLNMCQAVPSYPPPAEFMEEVARLAHEPGTSLYTDISGTAELREAHAKHMAEDYGGAITPSQVTITAGCNQAVSITLMALAGSGDNVVLPVPYFFNHQMWLDMMRIEARHVPGLSAEGPWPDVQSVADAIDARTKAIIICSPNNPTGANYPAHVIGALFDLARAKGIALVIDETYKDFRDASGPPHDLFQRRDWADTFVQLFSFSKTYAMTGYRVGSIIASERFVAEAEKIMDCMAICAPHISQQAALFGLTKLKGWKDEKRRTMAERTAALREAFKTPALKYGLDSVGAYFAYVKHPFENESAKTVARRLAEDHDLLCLPGSMFGSGQERHLRIAFAALDAEYMPMVVERLIESQG